MNIHEIFFRLVRYTASPPIGSTTICCECSNVNVRLYTELSVYNINSIVPVLKFRFSGSVFIYLLVKIRLVYYS